MSLNFTISPVTSDFLSIAYDIQTKLKDEVTLEITITIDTNYTSALSTRINKWKKQSYIVITIDQDYNESNSIDVIFSNKGSRPQFMLVQEFIDLVASFEYNDDNVDDKLKKDIIPIKNPNPPNL